jgi:hypothetical protein
MDFKNYLQNIFLEYKVVSIIGLAKNVSKTTTLNHIIKYFSSDLHLGLTSIGRDGEKYDIISEFPKPRIKIKKGTLVATAQDSLKNSDIEIKQIKNTEISTPMGQVLILEAMSDGLIELAGPSSNTGLKKVCEQLVELQCDLVLIDGAFDRRSFASPLISDATIISTGASVSKNMNMVIELTAHTIELLSTESEKDQKIREIVTRILTHDKVGFIFTDLSTKSLDLLTAITSGDKIAKMLTDNVKYVVINGAIVENATKLFIRKSIYNKFLKKGGILKVLTPIKIIALTINPTSPYGYNFDKNIFFKALQDHIKIPIFDLGPN